MKSLPLHGPETIREILPHRPPFLFVDRVTVLEPGVRIVAERDLRAEEPHFTGHFPGAPMMPGVLVAEALAQTSGLLCALSLGEGDRDVSEPPLFLAKLDLKFPATARPGETMVMEARLERAYGTLFRFQVEARSGERAVAKGTLMLGKGGRP